MEENLTGTQIKAFIHKVDEIGENIANELNLIADSLKNALGRSTISQSTEMYNTYVTMGDSCTGYKETIQAMLSTMTTDVNNKRNKLQGINDENASEVVNVKSQVESLKEKAESYKNKYSA